MKKIVFNHLLNDFSGSPKVLSQVIKITNDNGYKSYLITSSNNDGFLNNLASQTYNFRYKNFNNKIFTLLAFIYSQIRVFIILFKKARNCELIYINTLLPFSAAIFGKIYSKEVIYHIHETSINPRFLKIFLRQVVNLTASRVIYVSNSLKKKEFFYNIKYKVIYNCISDSFYKNAIKIKYKPFDSFGKFNVTMISSLKLYKGLLEFIKISKKLKHNNSIVFNLILNANDDEIKDFKKKYGLSPNINIYGSQTDLNPFYSNTSLLLNLSRVDEWIETFGLTIIEAFAYGIPVIVPPVGGPSEIVKNGVEGYLISSYETNELVNRISILFSNPKLCNRLSKNALKKSVLFNEKKFSNEIINFLNE